MFRVFVSSTFSDLVEERRVLHQTVFPEMQKLCETHNCLFQAVDLRWGVSDHAALDQQTMNICLGELRRCQTVSPRLNFLIILGDRYGWLPAPTQIDATEFEALHPAIPPNELPLVLDWYRRDTNAVPTQYVLRPRRRDVPAEYDYDSWCAIERKLHMTLLHAVDLLRWPDGDPRRVKYKYSATHQEILHGALAQPDPGHILAFLRTIDNVDELPPGSPYGDDSISNARALKSTIRAHPGITTHEYPVSWTGHIIDAHLAQFAADALYGLRCILETEIRDLAILSPSAVEQSAHRDFAAQSSRHFVGRLPERRAIASYVRANSTLPLSIIGPPGIGKSALFGSAACEAREAHPGACIIERYVGATHDSTDAAPLFASIIAEMRDTYGKDHTFLPINPREFAVEFANCLSWPTADKPFILFIDAIERLSDPSLLPTILPSCLPAHVRVILSYSLTQAPQKRLRSIFRSILRAILVFILSLLRKPSPIQRSEMGKTLIQQIELGKMRRSDGRTALKRWFGEAQRVLTNRQRRILLAGFDSCRSPMYLRLAFEECRRWRSWEQPSRLPKDIEGMTCRLLAQLEDERNHGPVLVKAFLGLLLAARHGLSEQDAIALLSDEKILLDLKARSPRSPETDKIPMVVWLRLHNDLDPYLSKRSVQGQRLMGLKQKTMADVVKERHFTTACHARLAAHFRARLDPYSDGTWATADVHALTELPYQEASSATAASLPRRALDDLLFLALKVQAGLFDDLLRDVWMLVERNATAVSFSPLGVAYDVIRAMQHRLRSESGQAFQYIINALTAAPSCPAGVVKSAHERFLLSGRRYLRQYRKPQTEHTHLIMTLTGHTAPATTCEFSPDGELAVSGGEDATVRLWNISTGKELLTLHGHIGAVTCCRFSPNGQLIASGGEDGTIRVWSSDTGRLCSTLSAPNGPIDSCGFVCDGERFFSYAGKTGVLVIWDIVTGAVVLSTPTRPSHLESGVFCLSPEGSFCAQIDRQRSAEDPVNVEETLTLRPLASKEKHVLTTMRGNYINQMHALAFSPDGMRLACCCQDGSIRLWNPASAEELAPLVLRNTEASGYACGITSFAFSSDGARILSGGAALTLWDITSGREMLAVTNEPEGVRACALTPDSRLAISTSSGNGNALRLWSLSDFGWSATFIAHDNGTRSVAFSRDGGRVVTCGRDSIVRVWNSRSGAELGTLKGHTDEVRCARFSPDGSIIASVSRDKTVRLWNTTTLKDRAPLGGLDERSLNACAFSPDGHILVSGGGDKVLSLWHIGTGRLLTTLGTHNSSIESCAFSPDGAGIVSGTYQGELKMWDPVAGRELTAFAGHTESVTSCSFSADGCWVVSGSYDCTVRVWDRQTGQVVKVFARHKEAVTTCSIAPNGRFVVSGGMDKKMYVWDPSSGDIIGSYSFDQEVLAVDVSPDSQLIACGDFRGNLFLFQLEGYIW